MYFGEEYRRQNLEYRSFWRGKGEEGVGRQEPGVGSEKDGKSGRKMGTQPLYYLRTFGLFKRVAPELLLIEEVTYINNNNY